MDSFLAETFEEVRLGRIEKQQFIERMAYVMTAMDVGDRPEVLHCFSEVYPFSVAADDRARLTDGPSSPASTSLFFPDTVHPPWTSAAAA